MSCVITFAATENAANALAASSDREMSLPIHDNRFIVDQNIQSLQIIINTNNVQSVKILGPAGMEVLPLQNAAGVSWQQMNNLYGITFQNPAIGQWEIKGSLLTTPKVIVDSTLKMITPDFPNNLFRGETLSISAYLTDNNKRVTSKKLLEHTQFIATLHNIATFEKYKIFLSNEDAKEQDVFGYDYTLQTLPGVYRLIIQATGLLFQRQQEQQFYLYDYPASISTTILPDTDELLIDINLQSSVLDEATCRFNALFTGKNGELTSTVLQKIADKKWQLFMPVSDVTHKVNLLLNAYTVDKRLVNITFPDVDVFAMYQKNLMDVKTTWEEKWRNFWQNNQTEQLGALFTFSPEKMQEILLFDVNQDLPKKTIPLRNYPNYQQSLLKVWGPMMSAKPQTLVDKMKAQELKDKAAEQALEAKKATAKKLAKVVPMPQPSPLRPWVLGILIMFVILFIALLIGILWVFKAVKIRNAYQILLNNMQVMLTQVKASPTTSETILEATTIPEVTAAEPTTTSVAVPATDATQAEQDAAPDTVTSEIAKEEITQEDLLSEDKLSKKAPLNEAPSHGRQNI